MVILIETLQQMKEYKDDTLYLAVSLADRYLSVLTNQKVEKSTCPVILAVTCLLLAAKVEEHAKSCIATMLKILQRQKGIDHVTKEALVTCEHEVLYAL